VDRSGLLLSVGLPVHRDKGAGHEAPSAGLAAWSCRPRPKACPGVPALLLNTQRNTTTVGILY
jgi:hypothetical protein